jgi:hypothetical protein
MEELFERGPVLPAWRRCTARIAPGALRVWSRWAAGLPDLASGRARVRSADRVLADDLAVLTLEDELAPSAPQQLCPGGIHGFLLRPIRLAVITATLCGAAGDPPAVRGRCNPSLIRGHLDLLVPFARQRTREATRESGGLVSRVRIEQPV